MATRYGAQAGGSRGARSPAPRPHGPLRDPGAWCLSGDAGAASIVGTAPGPAPDRPLAPSRHAAPRPHDLHPRRSRPGLPGLHPRPGPELHPPRSTPSSTTACATGWSARCVAGASPRSPASPTIPTRTCRVRAGVGVWHTDDAGHHWWPRTDDALTAGAVGAVAVAESRPDVIYVGTGSACIRGNVSVGRGAWKSTDRGETWDFHRAASLRCDRGDGRTPRRPGPRVRGRTRQPVRAQSRARGLPLDGRRRELGERALPQRQHRCRLSRDEPGEPGRDLRGGCGGRSGSRGR